MQDVIHTPNMTVEQRRGARQMTISLEALVYLALAALALALRVAELDTVPMMPSEIPQALAAWRGVSPLASGDPLIPPSALLFTLQSLSFTVLGGTEVAARLLTALAGAALVITPALFRGVLGSGQALVLSVFLLCSPVLLFASRFGSPVVWSLLALIFGLWGLWKWSQTRQTSHGILVSVMAMTLIFLTEPGGSVLAAVVALSLLMARMTSRSSRFNFDDGADTPSPSSSFPWRTGLAVGALVVVVVATEFMLHPARLSAVGETLAGTLRGFTQPAETPLLPLASSLFYEPFLWALGVVALVVLVRRGDFSVTDRFLLIWLLLGAVASLLFAGGTAAHGLWTIIPLAVLVSRLATDMLSVDHRPSDWSVPYWARGVIALVTVGLLAIFTLAFQSMARAVVESLDGTFAGVNVQLTSVILIIIPILFLGVIYFTAVSLWNARTALRGFGLGVVVFALASSLGSGWVASVVDATDPLEPFHLRATSGDVFLMRSTLMDVADRQTNGFTTVSITAEAPQDGIVAWVLRDFTNTRFISDINQARGDSIVISTSPVFPDLGGSYVGQDFMLEQSWSLQALTPIDLLAWWTQGWVSAAAQEAIQVRTAFLWLRQDVYNGVPLETPSFPR